MAQQLWLLRHGEAEPKTARADRERRLTPRGEDQSRAAGRAFAALGLTFGLVVTSPKARALDTARLACAELGLEPVVDEALADDLGRDEALAFLGAGADDRPVLLVGHNPDLPQLVHDLTGARVELKKGGVAGVQLRGRAQGELVALLRPRELQRLR
ncbi:MAG: histidine phosphatase family protein [Actinomycetota bacterium]|nr:histidine phosphatase family protein [Actinomycetota bacterium]